MILHLLLRLLSRLGDRASKVVEWLKRPAPRGQVIVNAVGVLVLVVIFSHYLIHRQDVGDARSRRQDHAICTVLIALGPPDRLPATFMASYNASFAEADCSQFSRKVLP